MSRHVGVFERAQVKLRLYFPVVDVDSLNSFVGAWCFVRPCFACRCMYVDMYVCIYLSFLTYLQTSFLTIHVSYLRTFQLPPPPVIPHHVPYRLTQAPSIRSKWIGSKAHRSDRKMRWRSTWPNEMRWPNRRHSCLCVYEPGTSTEKSSIVRNTTNTESLKKRGGAGLEAERDTAERERQRRNPRIELSSSTVVERRRGGGPSLTSGYCNTCPLFLDVWEKKICLKDI